MCLQEHVQEGQEMAVSIKHKWIPASSHNSLPFSLMCMVLQWVRRWGGNVQRTLFLISKRWCETKGVWVCTLHVKPVTSELNRGGKTAQPPSPALAVNCASVISRNIDHMLDFVGEKSSASVLSAPPQLQSKPFFFFSLLWPAHSRTTAVNSLLI